MLKSVLGATREFVNVVVVVAEKHLRKAQPARLHGVMACFLEQAATSILLGKQIFSLSPSVASESAGSPSR